MTLDLPPGRGPQLVRHHLALEPSRQLVPPDLARRALLTLLHRLEGGTLVVVEGARRLRFGSGAPETTIEVRDPRAWALVAQRGSVGLGEAYIEGHLVFDDLTSALRLMVRNIDRLNRWGNRTARVVGQLGALLDRRRRASAAVDRRNIVAHYDVGDDFFELFLDRSMTYSSGVFATPDTTLAGAQIAKLERICRKLDLSRDDHLVEIGTGWGSFAIHAATTRGCRVTTTTISDNQFATATARVAAAGLTNLVEVRRVDYRELEGSFSKLASIEMIEAVDFRDYDTYFGAIDRLLAPGGVAVLQAILLRDEDFDRAKRRRDFIKAYVFPGGCLPSVAAIERATTRVSRRQLVDLEDLGPHYAVTLRRWRDQLEANLAEVRRRGYSERFVRLWRFYLAYCEAAFAEGHVSVAQLVLGDQTRREGFALRQV